MPTKMSDAQIKEIESMLNNVLKKKVNLDFKFDPSLISGAKLQIGSLMVDDTAIKAKLNKIVKNYVRSIKMQINPSEVTKVILKSRLKNFGQRRRSF